MLGPFVGSWKFDSELFKKEPLVQFNSSSTVLSYKMNKERIQGLY